MPVSGFKFRVPYLVTTQVHGSGVHGSKLEIDEEYILPDEFKDVYEQTRRTCAAIRGFIIYLKKYEERKATNREP